MLTGSTPHPETMKRAAFARFVNRDKSAVTLWVKSGKLSGAALAPNGDIVVDAALAQLGIALDLGQQMAQAQPIAPALDLTGAATAPTKGTTSSDQHLLLKAKREEAEANAAAARRKEAQHNGTLVHRDEIAAEWTRTLTQLLADLDNSVDQMAENVAAKFKIDDRAVAFALREELRAWRAKVAKAAKADAEQQPAELEAVPA